MLAHNTATRLRPALADRPVVLLHGARQAGKTDLPFAVADTLRPRGAASPRCEAFSCRKCLATSNETLLRPRVTKAHGTLGSGLGDAFSPPHRLQRIRLT